jgi:Rha family phage regulatory protein
MILEPVPRKPRIMLIDGRVMTTSLVVAEHFGKRHKDVLRAIDDSIAEMPDDFHRRNFAPMIRPVMIGKGAIREERAYRMTRDGFALIAMGFTGKAAIAWKVAYINTFNAMEAALARKHERSAGPSAVPALPNPIEQGLPPRTPHAFLELYHALGRDYAVTLLVCYFLSRQAHRRALCASYRDISRDLDHALSRGGVRDAALRLADRHLLQFVPVQCAGSTRQFRVVLDTLVQRLDQARMQPFPGLIGDASLLLPPLS